MEGVDLLRLLGHKYNVEILSAANEPKSAQELSEEIDIPIATSYRRIEELAESGLLELEGHSMSEEGRRSRVYVRKVDDIHIELNEGHPEIKLKSDGDGAKLATLWEELKR